MAESKQDKIEKQLKQIVQPDCDGELSDADIERVAGGTIAGDQKETNDGCNTVKPCV